MFVFCLGVVVGIWIGTAYDCRHLVNLCKSQWVHWAPPRRVFDDHGTTNK